MISGTNSNGNSTLSPETTFVLIRLLTDKIVQLEGENKLLIERIQK